MSTEIGFYATYYWVVKNNVFEERLITSTYISIDVETSNMTRALNSNVRNKVEMQNNAINLIEVIKWIKVDIKINCFY